MKKLNRLEGMATVAKFTASDSYSVNTKMQKLQIKRLYHLKQLFLKRNICDREKKQHEKKDK